MLVVSSGMSIFFCTHNAMPLSLLSTLYHAEPAGSARNIFRVIRHSAVYVLIAGTYTPFMLGYYAVLGVGLFRVLSRRSLRLGWY